jgi:hypothetical protein
MRCEKCLSRAASPLDAATNKLVTSEDGPIDETAVPNVFTAAAANLLNRRLRAEAPLPASSAPDTFVLEKRLNVMTATV